MNRSSNLATWRGVPQEKRSTRQSGLDTLTEIPRSVPEGVRAVAMAEVERANGFRGLPSSTQYASNTIDLADRAIDRLALWREEAEGFELARAREGNRLALIEFHFQFDFQF